MKPYTFVGFVKANDGGDIKINFHVVPSSWPEVKAAIKDIGSNIGLAELAAFENGVRWARVKEYPCYSSDDYFVGVDYFKKEAPVWRNGYLVEDGVLTQSPLKFHSLENAVLVATLNPERFCDISYAAEVKEALDELRNATETRPDEVHPEPYSNVLTDDAEPIITGPDDEG